MLKCVRIFPHRLNVDGTFDAICPDCLKTISNEHVEDRLLSSEASHTCKLGDLDELHAPKWYEAG
jgi:hypothetical protein